MINQTSNYNIHTNLRSSVNKNQVSFKRNMDKKLLSLAEKLGETVIVQYDPHLTDLARCKIKLPKLNSFNAMGKNLKEAFNNFLEYLELKDTNKLFNIPVLGKLIQKLKISNPIISTESKALNLSSEIDSPVKIEYLPHCADSIRLSFPEYQLIGNLRSASKDPEIYPIMKTKIPTGSGANFNSAINNMAESLKDGDILLDLSLLGKRIYEVCKKATGTLIKQKSIGEFTPKAQKDIEGLFEASYGQKQFIEPGSIRPDIPYTILKK